ncbi:carbon monoxide dehydrogenase D protein [Pseudonocardia sp. Ae168_Ps1]|uniref:MadB family AAA-type ATPase n=1 Tax=unclassified Pseudonocardia TaxID=2619320 RepID=UPI00094B207B|nr:MULTISPECIES: MoxR family ATPase [unclassified Pseudonocardia]OLL74433.1 carbon monoxide dehydrogenase D protein [Pseudonocardia sp. Ae150A_Ps1]OLL80413.1 carbon monoxide dehydrogenase D protein [Pseudonocardia sp. Ae168_Ps1]OLL85460.1 carbon monoxide dehydrogenase D protein [Pseudonocardia sp. Ae263_Ps1]OLL94513.1 carbon monoxide dehydrogenase D protein [Pseudonocardia sp. Ae356_Ps1]
MFESPETLTEALAGENYVIDPEFAVVVHLATALERPLLLEGPAGVGKTELAKSLAAAAGRTLIRLQCYEGLDDGRALYEWDYGKQLMHVQMLRDRIGELLAGTATMAEASARLQAEDTGLYTEHFLSARPLLEAVLSPEPVVLLVDEVDRTEESMEALLLEVLAERQVTVPEIGTFTARSAPWVVLTSNDTRELSPALKRRCLHYQVGFPTPERETEIVSRRAPEVAADVVTDVVELARRLREFPLRKSPSISEVVDASRAAAVLGLESGGELEKVRSSLLAALLKYGSDRELAVRRLDGAEVADEVGAADDSGWVSRSSRPADTTSGAFGKGRATSTGSRAATDRNRRGRR